MTAPFAGPRDFDAGKRIVGRKRHVAVDTHGRLLVVTVTPAEVSDSAGAPTIPAAVLARRPWSRPPFADAGDHPHAAHGPSRLPRLRG